MQNPLLNYQENPFLLPDFSQVKSEHFLPALETAMADAYNNLKKIKALASSFESTIVGLETSTEDFDFVAQVFSNLFEAESNDELVQLAPEIHKLGAQLYNDILFDKDLFQKIKEVYESNHGLQGEDLTLLKETYDDFVLNGALLNSEKQDELRNIDNQLSDIVPVFDDNIRKATNAFELLLTEDKDLDGLPEWFCQSCKEEAEAKGKQGWLISLQAPSFIPFLTYSRRRELRQKVVEAHSRRAYKDQFDNSDHILKIAQLYDHKAKLLGFPNYTEFALKKRMAKSTENLSAFVNRLLEKYKPAAEKDLKLLEDFGQKNFNIDKIQLHDVRFLEEQYKKAHLNFDEDQLKLYFKLENVVNGVLEISSKLFEIKFQPIQTPSKYHKDVEYFQVTNKDGSEVGLVCMDFHPRETKSGGAWMTSFHKQGLFKGKVRRPVISIVCNFTKPTSDTPSLLTLGEVETLFHEFGHALHGLLSNCKYQSLAGTSVKRDFVELPSQIMENFVHQKQSLKLFAKHYQSEEPLPDELIEKIREARQFLTGYWGLRQVTFTRLDLSWFSSDLSKVTDVKSFERSAIQDSQLPPPPKDSLISTSFGHIFGGGYTAGYYGYKWAEVLDADAFEAFLEKDLFDPEVAKAFKKNILEKGGTEPPDELYRRFRGRDPDPSAMFRREGL